MKGGEGLFLGRIKANKRDFGRRCGRSKVGSERGLSGALGGLREGFSGSFGG